MNINNQNCDQLKTKLNNFSVIEYQTDFSFAMSAIFSKTNTTSKLRKSSNQENWRTQEEKSHWEMEIQLA